MLLAFVVGVSGVAYCLLGPRHYAGDALGQVPWGVREVLHSEKTLRLDVQSWDGSKRVYFRSDPGSLKRILDYAPFKRVSTKPEFFAMTEMGFPEMEGKYGVLDAVRYERTDLPPGQWCRVTTDGAFSFAYIEYNVK